LPLGGEGFDVEKTIMNRRNPQCLVIPKTRFQICLERISRYYGSNSNHVIYDDDWANILLAASFVMEKPLAKLD